MVLCPDAFGRTHVAPRSAGELRAAACDRREELHMELAPVASSLTTSLSTPCAMSAIAPQRRLVRCGCSARWRGCGRRDDCGGRRVGGAAAAGPGSTSQRRSVYVLGPGAVSCAPPEPLTATAAPHDVWQSCANAPLTGCGGFAGSLHGRSTASEPAPDRRRGQARGRWRSVRYRPRSAGSGRSSCCLGVGYDSVGSAPRHVAGWC
jgi:hypothetical protein